MSIVCRFFLIPLMLSLFACCASKKPTPVTRDPAVEYELVVVHTNDQHGALVPTDGAGGLAPRAAYVAQTRAAHANVLVLDAGDVTGFVSDDAAVDTAVNKATISAYNAIGYDAVTFGVHDLNVPKSTFAAWMPASQFAWLGTNVYWSGREYLGVPYIVRDFEGFRVGIAGVTTAHVSVFEKFGARNRQYKFSDEIRATKAAVKRLREKERADVVIVLAHLGSQAKADGHVTVDQLAESLSGVDLIIDGNTHDAFDSPLTVNGIPIVAADARGTRAGEVTFSIRDGAVTDFDWRRISISPALFDDPSPVTELLAPALAAAAESRLSTVGVTAAAFDYGKRLSRYRETAFGDLLADSAVAYARAHNVRADFAIVAGGLIRAELPAGVVTRAVLADALPGDDTLAAVTVDGKTLLRLFQFLGSVRQGAAFFPQLSREVRCTITYDKNRAGDVSGITIGGKPLSPRRRYTIVLNDRLVFGDDRWKVLDDRIDSFHSTVLMRTAVAEYLKKHGSAKKPLAPLTDGRLTISGGLLPE